jgi:8-oxo-dGTP pyrophosphatase MutT (NUDIX family)
MSTHPPLIRDPSLIPVMGVDEHLPAVPLAQLSEAALRARFARSAAWTPTFAGDGQHVAHNRLPAAAAVLIPLVLHEDGPRVLLTRRTDHLRDHAGQISFPGGRAEPGEDDPAMTALREAEEEVGLPRAQVEVIGCMPVYTTITSFVVTPVVALVRTPLALQLDPFEVAEAFEVPLSFLMTPAHHRRHRFESDDGQSRHFLSMPWQGRGADGEMREYFIWGATAAMLHNLYRFLSV